jgi:hypothetical protein
MPGSLCRRRGVRIATLMGEGLPRFTGLAPVVPGPFPGIGKVEGDRRVPEATLPTFQPREIIADSDAGREPLSQPLGLVRFD